ncbi:hypothetical protein Ciccas_002225 [Cichlidogyrus casuarinus]|uniref:Uncharacterized protein n=1 Tax=Cichlidogyrus casuarinus TaxID=1844966 RepID=A0ABD2QI37_9PLAT
MYYEQTHTSSLKDEFQKTKEQHELMKELKCGLKHKNNCLKDTEFKQALARRYLKPKPDRRKLMYENKFATSIVLEPLMNVREGISMFDQNFDDAHHPEN